MSRIAASVVAARWAARRQPQYSEADNRKRVEADSARPSPIIASRTQ
jgi:hypothetical protein